MDRSFKREAVNYGPMDDVSFYPHSPQLDQSSLFRWIMLGKLIFILILSILMIAFLRIATKPVVYVFTLFCFLVNILLIFCYMYHAISIESMRVMGCIQAFVFILFLLTLAFTCFVNFSFGFVGMACHHNHTRNDQVGIIIITSFSTP
uniref:Uncharacterized protein n=1 Tax=Trichogramma kaykai TaxID=54128 RepID=A0ABD2WXV3_9HYME